MFITRPTVRRYALAWASIEGVPASSERLALAGPGVKIRAIVLGRPHRHTTDPLKVNRRNFLISEVPLHYNLRVKSAGFPEPIERRCIKCGGPFRRRQFDRGPRQHCSWVCAGRDGAPSERGHVPSAVEAPTVSEKAICSRCGSEFRPTGHRFCSIECARAARHGPPRCRTCNSVVTTKQRTRFCGDECYATWRRQRARGAEERAEQYGVAFEPFDYLEVFRAAGWKCQICGCDTPPSLRGTKDPRAPELDHIVPMARGGPHVRSNAQLACKACNNRKRANLPSAVPAPAL